MTLSWDPQFASAQSDHVIEGDILVDVVPFGWTAVLFTLHWNDWVLDIDDYTAAATHTIAGDVIFTAWTLPGPVGPSHTVHWTLTTGTDDFESPFSYVQAKIPIPGATVLIDEDVTDGSTTVTNPLDGLCLVCVATTNDSVSPPSVVFPGDYEDEGIAYNQFGSPGDEGNLYVWASDEPGPFDVTSADMERLVLFGAPPVTDSWHVGGTGRSW